MGSSSSARKTACSTRSAVRRSRRRDVGAFYFGWEASNGALRYYTGLKPIMLTGYVNGCAMGFLRGHGLRFDERNAA
ncbi:MAG: hypothetical protein ABMA13_14685 [Chthoniobacteraceae bacterium]